MTAPVRPDPATLTRGERALGRVVRAATRVPGLRRLTLARAVALPGYALATGVAWAWGRLLGGRVTRHGRLRVVTGLPTWAYGRGGTTIGGVYLTTANVSPDILEHEDVHRLQWRRYGLAFLPLYLAAGSPALTNRFEVEAGLEKGGYVRPGRLTRSRPAGDAAPSRGDAPAAPRPRAEGPRDRDPR